MPGRSSGFADDAATVLQWEEHRLPDVERLRNTVKQADGLILATHQSITAALAVSKKCSGSDGLLNGWMAKSLD